MKNQFERQLIREMRFWFSDEGKELQLCLVAQGYEVILFGKLAVFLGSGFPALKVINQLKKEIEGR